MTERIKNIVVIRPGALGDVLVARGVIHFLRDSFPRARLTLLAPGERGRLFMREEWAHRVYDWDAAEFAWFFTESASAPGSLVREAFSCCDLLISFVDAHRDGEVLSRRFAEIAPDALRYHCAPHPAGDADETVGEWLLRGVAGFCRERGVLAPGHISEAASSMRARLVFPPSQTDCVVPATLVIHPGSGSRAKNWPVENFASLAIRLLEMRDVCGKKVFSRLVVTHGEADGELGERLCGMVRDACPWPMGSLRDLACLLAGALLYVGNDSGVSHLASAVCGANGAAPRLATIFGPSNARLWAPPGALVLDAGKGMDELSPEEAYDKIASLFMLP